MASSSEPLYNCLPIPKGDRNNLAELHAIRMALIHNIFIRGINSMISYAPEIQPSDLKVFMKYCEIFEVLLHHHHRNEEEVYFNMLEEKMGAGSMKDNVDGHKGFKAPYESWSKLCEGIRTGSVPWKPSEFIASIRAFTVPLLEHLEEEINSLDAEVVRQKFTQADLTHIEEVMDEAVKKEGSLIWHPPFVLVNGDGVNGKWFPPAPAPLIFIVRHILFRFHSDVWRFGCADKYMRIKERFAAYEPIMK